MSESDLLDAAHKGDTPKVAELLNAGADIDFQDDKVKETALMRAAVTGRLDAVKLLIAHGAKLDLQNVNGRTALFWAAHGNHPEVMKELLDAHANPDLADGAGDTPLTYYFSQHEKVIKVLLDAGANPNVMNNEGWTPLMRAAWAYNKESLKMLLDKGANLKAANADGESALTKAKQRAWLDLVDLLKRFGAPDTPAMLNKSPSPPEKLSPAQLWALAVSAILVQANGRSHEVLGFETANYTNYRSNHQHRLLESWEVHDRGELEKRLEWLSTTGHRVEYRKKLAAMNPAKKKDEFSDFFSKTKKQPAAAATPPPEETKFLAWDLCRYVWVARAGYGAGYLSEAEAWQRIMPVAQRIQKAFPSWKAMGADYLAGRAMWSEEEAPRYRAIYEMLINPADPNSPWTKNPWNTPLDLGAAAGASPAASASRQ